MRAQFIRGQDPKDSLDIGDIRLRADSRLKNFLQAEMEKIVNSIGGVYKIRRHKDSSWSSDLAMSMYAAYFLLDGQKYMIRAFIPDPIICKNLKSLSPDINWKILANQFGSEWDREYPGSQWFLTDAYNDDSGTSEYESPSDYFI
jgi:hypothetical protein